MKIHVGMSKDRQLHWTPENNLDQNCRSKEGTRDTNDYCEQQQRLWHQPKKYSDRQQYHQIRQGPTSYSLNTYGSKTEHCNNINNGIPTQSRNILQ